MYSKKSGRGSLPPRMPAHYSGWAFQPPPASGDHPVKPGGSDRPPQPPEPPKQEIHQSYPRPLPFLPPPVPDRPREERPLPPFPPAVEQLFGKSGFLQSLDFEELLLIGLIVLLGSGSEDNELPLLLALLLFC